MSDLGRLFFGFDYVGYTSSKINQIRKKLCHSITHELEGFRRSNWAQIEAELCVSDLGGLFFWI